MAEVILGVRDAASAQRLRLLIMMILAGVASSAPTAQPPAGDWTQFGWDVASSSAPPQPTGITASNLNSLKRRQVSLDGTVDASAIYLHAVSVNGSEHDVFFVTTVLREDDRNRRRSGLGPMGILAAEACNLGRERAR